MDKREGDGATPRGIFALQRLLVRLDRQPRPKATLPTQMIRVDQGWCNDPAAPAYNREIRLPARDGHEVLAREDGIYDVIIVLDHNRRPRVRGRGSAIFFHLARPDYGPTEGCVAISPADMRRLLPRLGRNTRMFVG